MSLKLFLLCTIAAVTTCCVNLNSVACDSRILINMGDNASAAVDLHWYLADLQVTAGSMQYLAGLNAKLVNELQERLTRKEVFCRCKGCNGGEDGVGGTDSGPEMRPGYRRTSAGAMHKLHAQTPLTWNEARKSCEKEGAKLAVVQSMQEAQMLSLILNQALETRRPGTNVTAAAAYMGVHSLFGKDDWITITGESLPRSWEQYRVIWSSSSNAGNATSNNCGVLSFRSAGVLSAAECDRPRAYFCEIRGTNS